MASSSFHLSEQVPRVDGNNRRVLDLTIPRITLFCLRLFLSLEYVFQQRR